MAFTEVGGWDHHAAEGGVQGQLAQRLRELGQSLAAFHKDMGERMQDVVVVTLTEFGRTVRENGNRGTDHGHASVSFVMGGRVTWLKTIVVGTLAKATVLLVAATEITRSRLGWARSGDSSDRSGWNPPGPTSGARTTSP